MVYWEWVNSLPYNRIFDWSKLKALADDSFSVAKMVQFFIDSVENVLGKGENAVYEHFLTMFS